MKYNNNFPLPAAAVLIVFSILILSGCTSSLETIKTNPSRYAGESVHIKGTLKQKLPIPFTEISVFLVDDSTATMVLIGPSDYDSGHTITTKVRVIGISKKEAVQSASDSADKLGEFLISREIAEPNTARKISTVIITSISKISGPISGSYMLIDTRLENS